MQPEEQSWVGCGGGLAVDNIGKRSTSVVNRKTETTSSDGQINRTTTLL